MDSNENPNCSGTRKVGVESSETNVSKKANRKRMKDRSPVWEHFDKEEDENGVVQSATCKYCKVKYNCHTKKNGTSTLWAHINKCRKYPYNRPTDAKQTLLSFQPALGSDKQTSGLTYSKFDASDCRKAVSFMIIVDELPFKFVEGQGFRHLCSVLEPRFYVPSRVTIAKDCYQIFLNEKRKLKSFLSNNHSRISLTTDTWTSIQQINYMCLTAHFIDEDWKLQKRILNFCPITSHKGEEVGKCVEKCLLAWGLDKIFCITVDNASSNDTAILYLKRKINNGWKTGVLDCRFLHMRCVAHIINLVVTDGMKFVGDSIIRVRHAVRFIKQSPARLQRFKKCVEDEKISSKKLLCLDVPTRWNSTFLMLSAALDLEGAFERYSEEDPYYVTELGEREGHGKPSLSDWDNVRRFAQFLGSFYELTLRVSGSLFVTSNLFFHELVNVAALLKELTTSNDLEMCMMASKMKEKYDKYWGDPEKINLLIFVAVVLDPRYKIDYVEWMLTEIYEERIARSLAKKLKECLISLFEEYRGSPTSDHFREGVSSSSINDTSVASHKKIELLKNKYKKQKHEKEGESKLELDKYLDEDTEEDCDDFDILGWWKFNSARFPTMGKIARDVLAVPISTVASESVFSTGGRILDPFRSSLTPKVVESLICAQDWLRSSPITINMEENLEELERLEEDLSKMSFGDDDSSYPESGNIFNE